MDTPAGFHGKIPTLGDFVHRRLPQSFIDPWDGWLQRGLAASKEQLQDSWLNVYLTSPIWRFMLASEVCGPNAWAGMMIPSVDRVGRYFPLTVAAPLPGYLDIPRVIYEAGDWFRDIENLMLSVLGEEAMSLDTFDMNVEGLGPPIAEAQRPQMNPVMQKASWRLPLSTAENAREGLHEVFHMLLLQRLGPYSLWWTDGSELVEPSLLSCSGLPSADGFSALLDGEWWNSEIDDWSPAGEGQQEGGLPL